MKLPPSLNNDFEAFLQALPSDYQQQAYEFKAFTRARKIKSPLQLLQVVMLYCGLDLSLRSCAGEVAQLQGYLSDTALKKRLAACVPWVKSLLAGVFGLESVVNSGQLRFIVIDGSTVQEPGAKETTYRLHVAVDLVALSLYQVEVTTDKEGENLDHYVLGEGDVVLIDRGYNQPKTLVPFIDRGGDVVLRYNAHSMNLYEFDDEDHRTKVDWESRLQSLNGQPGCIPVELCYEKKRIKVWLHAIPLPPEAAEKARRNAKARARKKGKTAQAKTLYLSEWVLILSSLPPEILETETIAQLYRVRWQVELVIKRMKSLLSVDQLRAKKESPLAELYLYGKLLYAAVTEKIARQRFPTAVRTLDGARKLTDWRLWRTVADSIKAGFKACFPAQECYREQALKALSERPRKRTLQTLPSNVISLIAECREQDLYYD